jgi:hypothetical protein
MVVVLGVGWRRPAEIDDALHGRLSMARMHSYSMLEMDEGWKNNIRRTLEYL